MNFDRMAESYYSSRDPQYVDWDVVGRNAEIEDLQSDINRFEIEDDAEYALTLAKDLIERAKDADAFDDLDWEDFEEMFWNIGIDVMRICR